jgi:hypothetical protein
MSSERSPWLCSIPDSQVYHFPRGCGRFDSPGARKNFSESGPLIKSRMWALIIQVQDTRRKNVDVVRRPLKQPKSATVQEFSCIWSCNLPYKSGVAALVACITVSTAQAICHTGCAARSSGRYSSVGTVRATFYN